MKKIPLVIAAVACSLPLVAPSLALAQTDTVNQQAGVQASASSIKSSIKAQYSDSTNASYGLSNIDVDVNRHGVVSLEGKVANQADADRAVSIARATAGVSDVKNQLKVKAD